MSQTSHIIKGPIHFSQDYFDRSKGVYTKPGDILVHTAPDKGVVYRANQIHGHVVCPLASLEGFSAMKLLERIHDAAPEETFPPVAPLPQGLVQVPGADTVGTVGTNQPSGDLSPEGGEGSGEGSGDSDETGEGEGDLDTPEGDTEGDSKAEDAKPGDAAPQTQGKRPRKNASK